MRYTAHLQRLHTEKTWCGEHVSWFNKNPFFRDRNTIRNEIGITREAENQTCLKCLTKLYKFLGDRLDS